MSTENNENNQHLFAKLKAKDFIRGTTPSDIDDKCLQLCRKFIGGLWNNANSMYKGDNKSTQTTIYVQRLTGGISNQIYRVRLIVSNNSEKNIVSKFDDQKYDVIIKLYESKLFLCTHVDDNERLNDVIILTTLSELGIGPRIYGIFKNGVIMAYVKVRYSL